MVNEFEKIGRAPIFFGHRSSQIEVHPESFTKTAFSTETGHYEILRSPFGLKNGPPTLQRAMNIFFFQYPQFINIHERYNYFFR